MYMYICVCIMYMYHYPLMCLMYMVHNVLYVMWGASLFSSTCSSKLEQQNVNGLCALYIRRNYFVAFLK